MIRTAALLATAFAAMAAGGLYVWGLSLPETTRAERNISFSVPPA